MKKDLGVLLFLLLLLLIVLSNVSVEHENTGSSRQAEKKEVIPTER